MNWLFFAFSAAFGFGLYHFFTKLSADKFNPALASAIIGAASFVAAALAVVFLKLSGQPITFPKNYLYLPIAAGLFAGIAEIFYLMMFAKNTPISIGNPLIVAGTTLIAVVLGLIFLKEPLNATKIFGILLTAAGLIFLLRG